MKLKDFLKLYHGDYLTLRVNDNVEFDSFYFDHEGTFKLFKTFDNTIRPYMDCKVVEVAPLVQNVDDFKIGVLLIEVVEGE